MAASDFDTELVIVLLFVDKDEFVAATDFGVELATVLLVIVKGDFRNGCWRFMFVVTILLLVIDKGDFRSGCWRFIFIVAATDFGVVLVIILVGCR